MDEQTALEVGIDLEEVLAYEPEPAPTEITGTDADALRHQRDLLGDEMRNKLNAGLGEEAVRIRRLMDECGIRIKAAEIKTAKDGIEAASVRLNEIQIERQAAMEIRKELTAILEEKVRAANDAGVEVDRVNLIVYQLDQEAISQRDSQNTLRSRIKHLMRDADFR